jgi:hypothetical protein
LIGSATNKAINAEARQWFIATVEKDELLGVGPATSSLSISAVRFQIGQERVLLPLPTRRTAGELLQVMASIKLRAKMARLSDSILQRKRT